MWGEVSKLVGVRRPRGRGVKGGEMSIGARCLVPIVRCIIYQWIYCMYFIPTNVTALDEIV